MMPTRLRPSSIRGLSVIAFYEKVIKVKADVAAFYEKVTTMA